LYGALADRRRNKRAAAEMLSPPDRQIPHFSPETPAPNYLSELQARRRPTGAGPRELSSGERAAIAGLLDDPATISVPVGMISRDFVTDPAMNWAVVDQPYVLVCAEPVATVREILGPLEKVLPTGLPLVVVAPALRGEVRSTLEVNAIQRTMALLGVEAEGDDLQRIARLTGAAPVPRGDLQSNYVPLDRLGRCARWVSTTSTSYLLNAADRSDGHGSVTDGRQAQP
jgi:hypothetical protein